MNDNPFSEPKIGFVGIGTIGFQIAENLVRSGYSIMAFDVRDEIMNEFNDIGGEGAENCKEIGETCRSVHIVVSNDEQAKDAVYGEEGIFAGFNLSEPDEENLLIIHSTLVPSTVMEFSKNAPKGTTVIDAPVSDTHGSNVVDGEITIMLGGDQDAIEGYQPVFETISAETIHLGPVGSGLATKLANNAIHHAAEVATFEALELGARFGIDQDLLLEAIRKGSGNTYFAQNFEYFTSDALLKKPSDPHWFAANIQKNLSQALKLSDALDVDVPLISLVSQEAPRWFKRLADEIETG